MNLIKSFGEDSPVIVVLNKIKDLPFDVNRRALKQKFPAIRAFVETDCAEPMGIEELRQLIERETDRLEHLRDAFPGSWFAIKGRLAGMEENYLLPDEYRGICVEHGEADPVAQGLLAGYLHTLGIALNYRDDPRLDDTHVLNPHWVTNGIYTILNAEDVAKQRGELAVTDVGEILDPADYPQDRHRFLLELMRRFELCFRFPEAEDRYLVPELLDKQQPPEAEDFAPEDCLNFEYRYPVLPEGLLPRFIVRTYVRSTGEPRWRTGVLLEFEGNRALVKADVQDKRVSIAVSGPQDGRRRLLAVIRSDFEHIHQSFIFQPAGMVPVPDHPDVLVPYEELVVMEQGGVRTLPKAVGGEVLQLDVTELLNGVDLEGTRKTGAVAEPTREEASGAARLFYSYSHKDEELRDELETHLKLLERRGVIEPWHDRRIGAGEEWRDQIDEDLEAADIILLLVSADFMASDYCYELETKRAVERHDAGEARVIPVIVRDVARHGAPFSKLQALPTDGKAVRTWPDRDTAWRTVAEGIERAVADLRRSRDERANDRRPGQGEAARSEMRGTGEREDAAQTGSGGPSITITGSVTGSNIGAVGRGDQQQSVTGPQPGVANVQQLAGPPAPTSAESTVVAVLFSDLKGYSLLQEPQRKRLHARADKDTAAILDRYEPLAKKFTGDGLVAAFGGTREAANCALDLSAYYRDLDWDALEVPALAMRIALHSGEASIAPHPLSGEPDMEGEAVIVAARIEPEVTPGEVWATDTCIGLLADRNQGGRFAWDDLGEHELAKAAGTRHLYRLRRS
ncbi:MAG: hypothetical protein CL878_14690 [Dehalococcoidia bacterium]|nr:hypothetical protein [Dehalococcoidia bacterium]